MERARVGELLVLATLIGLHAVDVIERLRGPAALGPAPAPPIDRAARFHPDEQADGVVCTPCPAHHVSARRRILLGGHLDPMDARPEELEALPGIGRTLARRLVAARPQNAHDLARVPGIGARRAHDLLPLLGLDGLPDHDICSTGSWPTTSSGCDRPR